LKLTNLDRPLTSFSGEPIQQNGPDGDSALTIKEVLLAFLTRMRTEKGTESMHVYKLGTEIYGAKDECAIESKDMALLKHAVEQNAGQTLPNGQREPLFLAMIQGQVLSYLDEIDTADKKKGD